MKELWRDLNKVQTKYLKEDILPGFRTKTEDLLAKIPNKAKGEQVRAMLKNAGVTDEEIRWLEIGPILDKPVVSKDELTKHLANHGMFYDKVLRDPDESPYGETSDAGSRARYQDYALKGGRNYTERVMHMKPASRRTKFVWQKYDERKLFDGQTMKDIESWNGEPGDMVVQAVYHKTDNEYIVDATLNHKNVYFASMKDEKAIPDHIAKAKAAAEEAWNQDAVKQNADNRDYKSSHWAGTNQVFHIRHQEFKDADGKHLFLIEEIQSDWHQEGRKHGYSEMPELPDYDVHKDENGNGWHVEEKSGEKRMMTVPMWTATNPEAAIHAAAQHWKHPAYDKLKDSGYFRWIPNAPMKKTWEEMAFKTALQEAIKAGADRIGWITGQIAAERFSLTKRVDRIDLLHVAARYPEDVKDGKPYRILAWKDDDSVFNKDISLGELDQYVGKDVAERLMKAPERNHIRAVSGDDLKMGGEGMKAAYDQRIVSIARKIAKAGGAQVGMVELPEAVATGTGNDEETVEYSRIMAAARKAGSAAARGLGGHYERPDEEGEEQDEYDDITRRWSSIMESIAFVLKEQREDGFPDVAKLIKKAVEVEREMPSGDDTATQDAAYDIYKNLDLHDHEPDPKHAVDTLVDILKDHHEKRQKGPQKTTVHYMDITDGVKEQVQKGLRLTFESTTSEWWKIV